MIGNYKTLLFITFLISTISVHAQWTQIGQEIDGEAIDDESGQSVSISSDGSVVAIGSPFNSLSYVEGGHVRMFKYNSGLWIQIGEDIDGEGAWDHSGGAISLSSDGSIVAIGAKDNDGNGLYSGHVRIFKNESNSWIQIGEDINGVDEHYNCGHSVSLNSDGSIVAIASSGNYGYPTRVFENIEGNWIQLGNDILGAEIEWVPVRNVCISADGSVVAVGYPHAIYIYEYNSSGWTQLGDPILKHVWGHTGRSVSLSSDGMLVAFGGPSDVPQYDHDGIVRIYKYNSGSWIQKGENIAGEPNHDSFGLSVSLSADGNIVAIGAPQFYQSYELNAGYVKIMEYLSSEWIQVEEDIIGETDGDNCGWSVSLNSDGTSVAVGSPKHDIGSSGSYEQGHVRVFQNTAQHIKSYLNYSIKIFPNPASEMTTVKSPKTEIKRVVIQDITGRIIANKEINEKEYSVDVSKFEQGVYLINIEIEKAIFTRKIIKK